MLLYRIHLFRACIKDAVASMALGSSTQSRFGAVSISITMFGLVIAITIIVIINTIRICSDVHCFIIITLSLVVATTLVMIDFLAVVIIIITSFSVIFTFAIVTSKHSSVAWQFRLETPTS